MFTTIIIKVILAAIIVSSAGGKTPPVASDGWYFCCEHVDGGIGEGCVEITADEISACAEVLHCESAWTWVDDSVVTCT